MRHRALVLALLFLATLPVTAQKPATARPDTSGRLPIRVARTPKDAPIVAACALQDKNITRVAVGGVGIAPTLVNADKPQSSISPIADFRGSVEYQREMVDVLVKRVMKKIRDSVLNL